MIDTAIDTARLIIGLGCNMACPYCCNKQSDVSSHDKAEEVYGERILEKDFYGLSDDEQTDLYGRAIDEYMERRCV